MYIIMPSTAHNNRKQFGALRPDAYFVRAAVAGRYAYKLVAPSDIMS